MYIAETCSVIKRLTTVYSCFSQPTTVLLSEMAQRNNTNNCEMSVYACDLSEELSL